MFCDFDHGRGGARGGDGSAEERTDMWFCVEENRGKGEESPSPTVCMTACMSVKSYTDDDKMRRGVIVFEFVAILYTEHWFNTGDEKSNPPDRADTQSSMQSKGFRRGLVVR